MRSLAWIIFGWLVPTLIVGWLSGIRPDEPPLGFMSVVFICLSLVAILNGDEEK